MTGILLVGSIPLAVTGLRREQLRNDMMGELNALGQSQCAKVANDVYLMLRAQHEKLKKEVRYDLNVADYVMDVSGGLALSPDRVRWKATNQSSGKTIDVDLEKVLIDNRWIGQNTDPAVPSPVVDQVRKLVGARCTVFQRMNKAGDLLRICTNVLKKDGTRAIGTYIPAAEPNGKENPVVAAIRQGKPYIGRARVVDDWYLTAYEPILDSKREVVGALFCGVRLEDVAELRKGIVDITVGRTSYAYVLGGSGEQRGKYIISRHGLRDGENIYDSQDASGNSFIPSIINEAMRTKNGDCRFARYAWRNPGENQARMKVVATTYFEPWDWVIGVGAYEDDFQDAIARVDDTASRLIFWGLVGAFLTFSLCGMLAWVESGRIAAMNREIADRKRAQEQQERMLRRLEHLNQLQKDMLLPGSLADKLRMITNHTVELFGLDLCRIWLMGPGDLCSTGCLHAEAIDDRHACRNRETCLHLMASAGHCTKHDDTERRIPLGCTRIGCVVNSEEDKFLTNDVIAESHLHNREWARSLGLIACAGYKLRDMHGKPIGVLAAFARRSLSEEEDAFLSNLAETASRVAVESKTEEMIRSSEAKYRTLFHGSSDAILYASPDLEAIAANAAAIKLFDCTAETEFISHAAADFWPERQPDGTSSVDKAKEMVSAALSKDSHLFEWTYRRLDGSEFPATVLLSRLELEGRTVLLVTVRDITAQKEAERALRESERRLANIIDFLPDATFAIDRNGKVIAWNRAIEDMSGVPASQVLGQGDYAYATPFHGEARPVLIDLIFGDDTLIEKHYSSVRRQRTQLIAESSDVMLRGGKATIWIVAAPLYDSDGHLVGAIESIRDVTEQRWTQEELRKSERRFMDVLHASSDAMLLVDDGKFVDCNDAAARMFGYPDRSAFLVATPGELSPPAQPDGRSSVEKSEEMMKTALQQGTHHFEWVHRRIDGTDFPVAVTVTVIIVRGRSQLLGVLHDITEQKLAEEALRSSERRYRLLADNVSDVIWVIDFAGRFTYVSPSIQQLLGYAVSETASLTLETVLTPESLAVARAHLDQTVAKARAGMRSTGETMELEQVRKNGSTVMTEVSYSGMYDESGQMVAIQGISRDITARKQLEEERRLTTQRMESLLALSHMTDKPMEEITATAIEDAVRMTRSTLGYLATMNEDESVLTIRYWSKSAHASCRIIDEPLSYPLETTGLWGEAVRQRRPVVTNDYAAPNPLKRGTPEGHVPIIRHMNIPLFEGQRVVAVAGIANKPTDYDDSDLHQLQLLMAGWQRIAAQKQYELDLSHARDDAQAANRAKSRFLATMSHEIRTPMTAILGYADLLMDPAISASTRNNYAATIHRNGEHLLALINDILDLSKIEAGKMEITQDRCRLVSLLGDIASLLRPRAEQRDVSFSVEYVGAIPETIYTDGARLRQTIINLAGNAVKFTEHGSVRLVVAFVPDGCHGRPGVRIDVIDTGIGIAADSLPNLFRPFSQGDAVVSQRFGGTGLGLAISNQLVRLLGGSLSVASELGHGTTFTLIVPTGSLEGVPMLENPMETMQESPIKEWCVETDDLTGVRILLAEDGFDNRELIQAVLRRVGADVETAVNGRIAVDKALQTPFDLVLMDMNMPEMDGYEATTILRDSGYSGPIVALTANAMIGDNERCREVGCNEYLAKPIDRRLLIHTVAATVDLKAVATRTALLRKIDSSSLGDLSYVATEASSPTKLSGELPSSIADCPVATTDQGDVLLSTYCDDPDIAPIIHQFVGNLAGQLDAMRHALAKSEYECLCRLAHRLKGAGGSYGFQSLTDAGKLLEEAAKRHDGDAAIAMIEKIASLVHSIENGYAEFAHHDG